MSKRLIVISPKTLAWAVIEHSGNYLIGRFGNPGEVWLIGEKMLPPWPHLLDVDRHGFSRNHLGIIVNSDNISINDLSSYGTFLEGQRMPKEPYFLQKTGKYELKLANPDFKTSTLLLFYMEN